MNSQLFGAFLLCMLMSLVAKPVMPPPLPDGCAGRYDEPRPPVAGLDRFPMIDQLITDYDNEENVSYVMVYIDHGNGNKSTTWFERYDKTYEITITEWNYDCGTINAPLAYATQRYLNGDIAAFYGYGDGVDTDFVRRLDELRLRVVLLPTINNMSK